MDDLTQSAAYFIVSAIWGLVSWRRNVLRIRRRGVEAEGKVIAVDSRWWTRRDGSRIVEISFHARTGKRVIFTIRTAVKCRVGDRIPVCYELINPDNVGRTDDENRNLPWLFVWWFILLIGITTLVKEWYPPR